MRDLRTGRRASAAFSIALLAGLSSGCGGGGSAGVSGPTLSIADAALDEGDAGTANLTFTVTLSEVAADDVTVDFATSAGTASAGAAISVCESDSISFRPM